MHMMDNDDWDAVDRQFAREVEFRAVPRSAQRTGNMSLLASVGEMQRYSNSDVAKAAREKDLDNTINQEPRLPPMTESERANLFSKILPTAVVQLKGFPFTPFIEKDDPEALHSKCKKRHPDCRHTCSDVRLWELPCSPCTYVVDYKRRCGHMVQIYCGNKRSYTACTEICNKPLACSHPCRERCHDLTPCAETCDNYFCVPKPPCHELAETESASFGGGNIAPTPAGRQSAPVNTGRFTGKQSNAGSIAPPLAGRQSAAVNTGPFTGKQSNAGSIAPPLAGRQSAAVNTGPFTGKQSNAGSIAPPPAGRPSVAGNANTRTFTGQQSNVNNIALSATGRGSYSGADYIYGPSFAGRPSVAGSGYIAPSPAGGPSNVAGGTKQGFSMQQPFSGSTGPRFAGQQSFPVNGPDYGTRGIPSNIAPLASFGRQAVTHAAGSRMSAALASALGRPVQLSGRSQMNVPGAAGDGGGQRFVQNLNRRGFAGNEALFRPPIEARIQNGGGFQRAHGQGLVGAAPRTPGLLVLPPESGGPEIAGELLPPSAGRGRGRERVVRFQLPTEEQ